MNIQVSVVIPIYNAEKYVRECIDSVRNQTLKEIEILCLDDGSVDRSVQILDEFADVDSRIKVVHKVNSGYGSTVNRGVQIAKGKYISIVEPDDYIELNMLQDLVKIAEVNNCDFVKSDYSEFWKDENERIFEIIKLCSKKELYQKCLSKKEIQLLFWGIAANPMGIYLRKFLNDNNITHNETPGASYQDVGFFFQVMMKAKNGYLTNGNYYRYRQDNPQSSISSKEKVYCVCDEFEFIYKKMAEDIEQFRQYLPLFQMYRFKHYLFNIKRISPCFRLDFLSKIQKEFIESNKKGELDLSMFDDEDRKLLLQIMQEPSIFLDEFFAESNKLREKVKKYSDVIIYGAGWYGNKVFEWLKEDINFYQHMFYAVSDVTTLPRHKHGIQIKSIYELQEYRKSAVVIVAVSNRYKNELVEVLNSLKFHNIVTLE